MLDKLREMTGGDEERIKMYVNLYQESIPEYCNILEKAIPLSDIDSIIQAVHSSKPLFAMMGFDDLYSIAVKLETDLRNGKFDEEVNSDAQNLLEMMKSRLLES